MNFILSEVKFLTPLNQVRDMKLLKIQYYNVVSRDHLPLIVFKQIIVTLFLDNYDLSP